MCGNGFSNSSWLHGLWQLIFQVVDFIVQKTCTVYKLILEQKKSNLIKSLPKRLWIFAELAALFWKCFGTGSFESLCFTSCSSSLIQSRVCMRRNVRHILPSEPDMSWRWGLKTATGSSGQKWHLIRKWPGAGSRPVQSHSLLFD